MARSIWSGSISFGLVNIPVKLQTATRDNDIRFHQLHEADNARVQYRVFCPAEDKEVGRDQIVKGYEVAPDQYVRIEQKELDALEPEKSRTIDIADFVDISQIDPLYYDRPYYLVPDEKAAKAYRLLLEAMTKAKKIAIAKFVMHNKEYLAAIRPIEGVLCLELMRWADEVVKPSDVELPKKVSVNDRELTIAQQLIDSLSSGFEPDKYHDEYRQRVQELIDRKAAGEEVVVQPSAQERAGPVINLMEALEKSLASARAGSHKRQAAEAKPKKPTPRRRKAG